jgi:lantibiotic modifying enzyme
MSDLSAASPPSGSSSWRPLLAGDAAAKAIATAEEIAAVIGPPAAGESPADAAAGRRADGIGGGGQAQPGGFRRGDHRDFSLADGRAGVAVFLSYLESALPGRGYGEQALQHLEQAIEGMGRLVSPPQLYSGFPGVAWAIEHLTGRLFASDGEDPGEEAARELADHLGQSPWARPFELIVGAVGLGVYALERLPRSHGEECLRRTVARLAEIAERRPDGITWWTPRAWLSPYDRERLATGKYNLGVSHGVPGVIAFLGEAVAALGSPEASALLRGAVAWLLRQRLPAGSPSAFPSSVAPDLTPEPTRISWCYGDLGISLALLGAARRAGEPAWEAAALALARGAAARPGDRSGIVDPGLCHGAAGAAHLFNRLFQASGDPLLGDAARGWIERTHAMRRTDGGLAGFSAWLPGDADELGWQDDPGLLTGAAGVGLALLAAATPIAPAWDRILLVSVPS